MNTDEAKEVLILISVEDTFSEEIPLFEIENFEKVLILISVEDTFSVFGELNYNSFNPRS